jgi:hypothetical protein
VLNLVRQFENRTLPKASWTHHAHLTVGMYYAMNFEIDEAIVKMRAGIIGYNESVGTMNTDSGGYHETITLFWMRTCFDFVNAEHVVLSPGGNQRNEQAPMFQIVNAFLESTRSNRNSILEFYSSGLLFSKEARKSFAEPDLPAANI